MGSWVRACKINDKFNLANPPPIFLSQIKTKFKRKIAVMKNWSDLLLQFYTDIHPPSDLPHGIEWLYPQKDAAVLGVVDSFLKKYFNDRQPRQLLLGINPGRFGAGITGVNFTAPRQLSKDCGIRHPFPDGTELSAEFIYDMTHHYGGVEKFFSQNFIGSVCPLGFVKDRKNINYYDDPELLRAVEPFIIKNLEKLISFPVKRETCFSIGGEKNFKYLSRLNSRYHWFHRIIPLPHPRFIMQYRRKRKQEFIEMYVRVLRETRDDGPWNMEES